MLLAAGFGTRLKPFTDRHPKALAEVNGKTLLQRNIEYLQHSGIFDVVINVHHFAEQIIQFVQKNKGWGSNISISDETDAILETGGGLQRAAWYFKDTEDFVLMNCDILTDLDLYEMILFHKMKKPLATLATTFRETSRYFLFNDENILCGWENRKTSEKKIPVDPVNYRCGSGLTARAFSGIHVINREIFTLMDFKERKFSMVDVYLSLCGKNKIISFDHSGSVFLDAGKPESLEKAALLFK